MQVARRSGEFSAKLLPSLKYHGSLSPMKLGVVNWIVPNRWHPVVVQWHVFFRTKFRPEEFPCEQNPRKWVDQLSNC